MRLPLRLFGVLALLAASSASVASAEPVLAATTKPNIVLVMVDDARPDEISQTADLRPNGGLDWIRDHGVQFDTYMSVDNLCCPGRAAVISGQTPFNNGVFDNEDRRNFGSNQLAAYMQTAGYCTGFTGKYHVFSPSVRPPGWTYWEPAIGPDADEYTYSMYRNDGTLWQPGDFVTDRLAITTRRQMRNCSAAGKPHVTLFWPTAPHKGSDPKPVYADSAVPYLGNDDPSFNESDMSDKPLWMQTWFPSVRTQTYYDAENARRVRTLFSVDDAVRSFRDTVSQLGQLDNTIFIVTSDNGFLHGEHRIDERKTLAFEAAQPPLWIAGPGFPVGTTTDAYASNIDLLPTILNAGGATLDSSAYDGRSLQSVLAESDLGHDRFIPFFVPLQTADAGFRPDGAGVRTWRYKYIEYADGSQELYDLRIDPHELENLSATDSMAATKRRLQTLRTQAQACTGETCRVKPPGSLR